MHAIIRVSLYAYNLNCRASNSKRFSSIRTFNNGTKYIERELAFGQRQFKLLADAIEKKTKLTLRFSYKQLTDPYWWTCSCW